MNSNAIIKQLVLIHSNIMNLPLSNELFRKKEVFALSSRDTIISFSNPLRIFRDLDSLIENYLEMLTDSNFDLSMALSYFWVGFISIHPFSNGNGRTAKAFLESEIFRLTNKKVKVHRIDEFLLTENTEHNLQMITKFFDDKLMPKEATI